MPSQFDNPVAREIELLLDAEGRNSLKDFLISEAKPAAFSESFQQNRYDLFIVQNRQDGAHDTFKLNLGSYSEEELYGLAKSPSVRFRREAARLLEYAKRILALAQAEVEFEHQATLLWSDIGRLTGFLGTSDELNEVVANLRVARAQFVARPTPRVVVQALADVLGLLQQNAWLGTTCVDTVLDLLEKAGVDLNYPLQFADGDA